MFLIFSFMFGALLFAQTPTNSANANKSKVDTLPPPVNSSNNMDSSSMKNNINNTTRMDSTLVNNMNNTSMDSSSRMNNNMNNSSSINAATNRDSMNANINNSGLVNPMNMPGQVGYAALPVLETYLPDMIISKIKERYGNNVYDITTVKSGTPQDSTMITPSAAMTSKDSTVNNQNTLTQNSTVSQQYNYVVRFQKEGVLTTETLNNDASGLAIMNGELNKQ